LVGEALVSKGGYIYTFFDGTSFDGSSIDARWMTKTLYGVNEQGLPALSHTKRWRWLDLLFRIDSDLTVNVAWFPGHVPDSADPVGIAVVDPSSESLITLDGSTILTADASEIEVAISSAQEKILLHMENQSYFHDEGLRLLIYSIDSAGSWALEGMQLAYQILPGLKRRSQ
jgi:hypothetical protein